MTQGLKRDHCLTITGLTKNQFYYVQSGVRPGRCRSSSTLWRDPATNLTYEVDNVEVVQKIVEIKLNPDLANGYRLIAVTLQIGLLHQSQESISIDAGVYIVGKPAEKIGGVNLQNTGEWHHLGHWKSLRWISSTSGFTAYGSMHLS